MKYQCLNESCGKLFVYPAKSTQTQPFAFNMRVGDSASNGQGDVVGEYGLQQGLSVTETYVCPYCGSIDIEEYTPEPAPQPQITSVLSVELAQVDSYLKLGYVVRELYAKTATLVKLEAKQ